MAPLCLKKRHGYKLRRQKNEFNFFFFSLTTFIVSDCVALTLTPPPSYSLTPLPPLPLSQWASLSIIEK